jgi:GNAT superfamily N-acetyltransferase
MTPRLTRGEYEKRKGAGNRRAMKRLVDAGRPTGVLGYLDDEPVAWCAVAPREDFSSLSRSRILRPVDDRAVWSIVCLFVARAQRERGVSVAMLRAAASYTRQCGARIVEAYPVEPKKDRIPPVFAYQGIASACKRAGFREVARRSPTRPIMRKHLR